MRRQWGIVLFVAATTSLISGQQTTPSAPSQLADDHSQHVKVYAAGPGVTSPQLLSTTPIRIDSGKCKKKMDSKVIFSVLVDSLGQPRNLMFLQPLGNEMDKFALQVASSDRFTPGTHDGAPDCDWTNLGSRSASLCRREERRRRQQNSRLSPKIPAVTRASPPRQSSRRGRSCAEGLV